MIKILIHIIPGGEEFIYDFDENTSIADLNNELQKRYKMEKHTFYYVMNDHIINDDMLLEEDGVMNDDCIKAIRNDYVKINIEIEDSYGIVETIKTYVPISYFNLIKVDENKEVRVCNDSIFLCFM